MFAKRQISYTTALVGISLYTTACTTTQPGIQVRTVTVDREVQKPCPGTVPVRPSKLATPLPTDAVTLAAVLAAKLLAYAGPGEYADRAEMYFRTCSPAQ